MEKRKCEIGACGSFLGARKACCFAIVCLLLIASCKTKTNIGACSNVCIQPYNGIENVYIQECKTAIENYYKCTVDILPIKNLPQEAYYKPRNRYRADKLIRILRSEAPKKYDRIIGLTNKDISTTKGEHYDWGILGLAFRPGKSCVVSTFRLKKNASQKKLLERLRKVSIHEFGHTLGLAHCDSKNCVMNDAKGTIKTVDKAKEELCDKCKKKLGIE